MGTYTYVHLIHESVITCPAWCLVELWRWRDPPQILYCPQWALLFLPISVHCDAPLYCWGHTHRSYRTVLGRLSWSGALLQEEQGLEVCVPRSRPLQNGNREEKPWEVVDWRILRTSLRRHVHDLRERKTHEHHWSMLLQDGEETMTRWMNSDFYLFFFSSPCCRVGEVTFLMQGVSWLSPLSWEESRERSLERRRCSR